MERLKEKGAVLEAQGVSQTSKQFQKLNAETEVAYKKFDKAKAKLDEFQELHGIEGLNKIEAIEELKRMGKEGEEAFEKVKTGAKKSGNMLTKFSKRVKGLALRVFIFSLIAKGFRSMVSAVQDGLKSLAQFDKQYNAVMSDFKSSTATLKNALATAFEPIVSVAIPYLTKLVNILIEASNKVSMFFASLQGKNTFTKAKKQFVDYAKTVEEANNKLASFDDLNVLQSDNKGGETTGIEAFGTAEVESDVSRVAKLVQSATEKMGEAFDKLKGSIASLSPSLTYVWENVFVPFGKFLGEVFIGIIGLIAQAFSELANVISNKSGEINRIITVLAKALQSIGVVLKALLQFVSGLLSGFITTIANVVSRIVSILNNLISFISNAFKGNWEKAWKSLANIFIEIWNTILDVLEGVINAVVRGINSISVSIPKWVPKYGGSSIGFNLQEVSWKRAPLLATGGVVDRPTQAIIGENGREAVLPLENNTEWMDAFAEKLSGTQTVTIKFDGSLSQLAKVLKPVLDAETSRIGTRLVVQ